MDSVGLDVRGSPFLLTTFSEGRNSGEVKFLQRYVPGAVETKSYSPARSFSLLALFPAIRLTEDDSNGQHHQVCHPPLFSPSHSNILIHHLDSFTGVRP